MTRELLANERIRLRALEPEDLELLYRWENDAALWTVGNTLAPYSRYVLKDYIARSQQSIYEAGQLRLMIEHKATKSGIGLADLYDFDPHNRRAGVGILLDPQQRGKGFATDALQLLARYAFQFLRLHQLYAHIPLANEPCRALFLRCRFRITARLTDWLSSPQSPPEAPANPSAAKSLSPNNPSAEDSPQAFIANPAAKPSANPSADKPFTDVLFLQRLAP